MTAAANTPVPQQEDLAKAFQVEDMSSYRDGFKNLVRLVYGLTFLMIALLSFNYWYISTQIPVDSYYAVSPGGTIRPLVGLPQPATNRDAILLWAGAAVTESLTFGFNDIDERFASARRLFSNDGWKSFYDALSRSRLLRDMMAEQHIMTSIPMSGPTLLAEGLFDGDYQWILDVPMIIAIRAGSRHLTARSRVRIFVIRLPTSENPMGLGIKTFVAN